MNTESVKTSVFNQFSASIQMLENAVKACPENLWQEEFWYITFHTTFFLDYYLTAKPIGFEPPKPFLLSEFEDIKPERIYSKDEILFYIEYCKNKLSDLIELPFDDLWVNESGTMKYTIFEILLYNIRHVQHHVGQLNKILSDNIGEGPDWIRG